MTPLERGGRLWREDPVGYFNGLWDHRNRLNVPGPFYGAETDTCMCGPDMAPDNLLCDIHGQDFVWRQPRTDAETLAIMAGPSADPFGGYAWDGDDLWTVELIREWWAGRSTRSTEIDELIRDGSFAAARYYRDYLAGPIVADLRRYLYFLELGSYPGDRSLMPAL